MDFSSTNLLKEQQSSSSSSSSSSTSVKPVQLCHTWVIEDFLTYFNSAGYANTDKNSCKTIESARFQNEHVQAYLKCFPCKYLVFSGLGHNTEVIYFDGQLNLVASKLGNTPVTYEVSCLGANGQKFQTITGQFSGTEPCAMQLSRFIQRSSIDGLLVGNRLTIVCDISYVTTATSSAYDDNAPKINHFEKMAKNFANLRKDSNFSDITLVVRGREFRAHKFWLCAQSPVFEAMFLRHDTKEKQENRVEITDVDSSVFEKLLDFIYSGKSDCVRGREDELLAAADKYALEQLKDACADELCKKLSPVTVTDLLVLADTYNVSKLKQKSLDYLRVHGQDTIQAMFTNNQTDNLVSAFRHLAMPGNSSSPGSSNQNSNRGGNNSQGRNNNNRNYRPRGGTENQSNQNSNN